MTGSLDDHPFDTTMLAELGDRLDNELRDLLASVDHGETTDEPKGGSHGETEHLAAHEQRDVMSVVDTMSRAAIDEITEALQRMHDGTYGRCLRCGEQIPLERLDAMPSARHCVTCQVRSESGPV